MPRAVPSQVVALIDDQFANARTSTDFQAHNDSAPKFAAIAELARSIPSELLQVSGSDHSDLILALTILEHAASTWERRGNVTAPQKIRGVHALTVLLRILALCPDQAPSSATAALSFITDA